MLAGLAARGEDFRLEATGVRFGLSSHDPGHRFYQGEAYTRWQVPWPVNLGRDWVLEPQLDLSAGMLHGRSADGFVGTLGPVLQLAPAGFPLQLEGGISPTGLSEDVFGDRDFGTRIQFTSHLGLRWEPTQHLELGYRFQHMSNAGLGDHNPGLNLHMFSVGYRW